MSCKIINRKSVLLCIFCLFVVSSYSQSLLLSQETFNFGDLMLNEKKDVSLCVKNVSDVPLVIKDANVACKCTKINYSKRPIMPNDSTFLKITFDAKELGAFYKKVVLIHTGEEASSTIILRGTIIE
ncbi:MAG: DUF1573 domain-containing protein [Rikenellaceae bacterium]